MNVERQRGKDTNSVGEKMVSERRGEQVINMKPTRRNWVNSP